MPALLGPSTWAWVSQLYSGVGGNLAIGLGSRNFLRKKGSGVLKEGRVQQTDRMTDALYGVHASEEPLLPLPREGLPW